MKDTSTTSAHIFIIFVIFTKLNVCFLALNTTGASKQHLLLVKSEFPKKHKSDYFHSKTKSREMLTVNGYIKKVWKSSFGSLRFPPGHSQVR